MTTTARSPQRHIVTPSLAKEVSTKTLISLVANIPLLADNDRVTMAKRDTGISVSEEVLGAIDDIVEQVNRKVEQETAGVDQALVSVKEVSRSEVIEAMAVACLKNVDGEELVSTLYTIVMEIRTNDSVVSGLQEAKQ